mmetsp:Transcript_36938/g.68689  ORF Transcript_36938/g.68689 Transcript_36938/m.68689 type:complete len:298 (+) Transcript_36938:103-996(+)
MSESKEEEEPLRHYYVGIGSMMNPHSMKLRDLAPLQSWPCRCVGFIRQFWGKMGMAEICEQEGGEFHAVLHEMSDVDMKALDKMERGYIRKSLDCYLYDGTHIVGTGYQFDREKLQVNAARPPSERYVDVMVEGMQFHGCENSAIEELRNTPNQTPRRQPSEYDVIQVPPEHIDRVFSWEEVEQSSGVGENKLRVVFNGKVMEFCCPDGVDGDKVAERYQRELVNAGKDVTHIGSKMMYDPLFPSRSSIDEMSSEHIAYAEDGYWRRTHVFPPVYFSCVGQVLPPRRSMLNDTPNKE